MSPLCRCRGTGVVIAKLSALLRTRIPRGNATYSQSGEDRILEFLIRSAQLSNLRYIDAGSSHPINGNNSYLLYRRGYRGVCIDPQPGLGDLYRRIRPDDQFLASAVAPGEEREIEFTFFSESTINSADQAIAQTYKDFGFEVKGSRTVPAVNLADVAGTLPKDAPVALLLDLEGLEAEVIAKLDFDRFRPAILCAEVVQYHPDRRPFIPDEVPNLMKDRGYTRVADTFINQVYMDDRLLSQLRFL